MAVAGRVSLRVPFAFRHPPPAWCRRARGERMSSSGESRCRAGIGLAIQAGRPAAVAVLGFLLVGLLAWSTFGPGVAAGRPVISIEDDGQVAGIPFTIHGKGF